MKKTISTVAVVAIAMAVSAAAAGVNQERIPDAQRPATTDASNITLTGCVARGVAADTYTLAETKKSATPAADTTTPPELVALTGATVDMSKHVGHSVTVSGSYAKADAVVGTAGAEKPAAPTAAEGTKKTAKTFTVTSVKMVSASC